MLKDPGSFELGHLKVDGVASFDQKHLADPSLRIHHHIVDLVDLLIGVFLGKIFLLLLFSFSAGNLKRPETHGC